MPAKQRNLDNLRSGYTTGACAAAAAQAAMQVFLKQAAVERVRISLPGGNQADFKVSQCIFDKNQAACSVIKDAGDDPDVTNGVEIWAEVAWQPEPGIFIEGGEGVGRVTKPGLEIAVGLAAINPVPRRMIAFEVSAAAGDSLNHKGVKVTIFVPEGAKLAKRTLNPRLGIVGGISILGTTGIVIPYSVNAYTASISQALDVAIACGCREAVLTTGRRSEVFALSKLALAEECFVQVGDYIGFSLRECVKKHLKKVIIWGMVGKISKLAAGHLYTHISDSEVDIVLLTQIARDIDVPKTLLKTLAQTVSANHFRETLPVEYLGKFAEGLCLMAARRCREGVKGSLEVECIMSDYDGQIVGRAGVKE